ncbi:MAG: ArsR family transcriptional regulator [Methanomicrobiales archaeon HGW-Methanomicrobiales-4]|nr:MAG: ArsR family transcriptional regulator [Methanomicrobiales archaeon HGW-Methanomicrobiales-4]
MKIGIVYHSHSGITRGVAEKIQKAVQGDLIEVRPQRQYSSLTVVAKGCYRALRGLSDPVTPPAIDVSGYDLIVLASPVWAGRPTPVINGAIDSFTGYQGKKVFLMVTCKDAKSGEQAVEEFKSRIEGKGMIPVRAGVLDSHRVNDETSINDLITDIRSVAGTL